MHSVCISMAGIRTARHPYRIQVFFNGLVDCSIAHIVPYDCDNNTNPETVLVGGGLSATINLWRR